MDAIVGRFGRAAPACANVATAVVLYAAFSGFLYYPYAGALTGFKWLYAVSPVAAATGCFVLSRRWTASVLASLFAGAIYGFGPFMLSLSAYHPLAGVPAAAMPWLCCPGVFYRAGMRKTLRDRLIPVALTAVPFAGTGLFFVFCSDKSFYPLPVSLHMGAEHLAYLPFPLALPPTAVAVGLYHVPFVAFIMGLAMYVMVHRIGVLVAVLMGLALALSRPVLGISPMIWEAIPMLYAAILVGLGVQGMAWTGKPDTTWLGVCAGVSVAAAVIAWLLRTQAGLYDVYSHAAAMYVIAAGMAAILWAVARAELRWRALRWVVLCGALGADIILGARLLVESISRG